jgi:hypothetical protein
MSAERISAQAERLVVLVEQHTTLLTNTSTDLPHYETTTALLRQQFEAHIGFLLVNLESYTALQASITTAITQHPADIIADAFPVSTPTAIPAEAIEAPRRNPRSGNFLYYAVRVGRITGIFTDWQSCFRATNGVTNDFRGFEFWNSAQDYLNRTG